MIALIADVHAANHRRFGGPVHGGINRRCWQVLDALKAAVLAANRKGCKGLVICGDLFDTVNPPQQIVTAVQKILDEVPTWVMLGNHEQASTHDGDHALGPLAPVSNIVTEPKVLKLEPGYELFLVPFQPGPAIDWLPKLLKEWCGRERPRYKPGEGATLLLHLGISDAGTPSYLRGHHDAVSDALLAELCKQYGFAAAFSGHWHWHKVHRKHPLVVQVGALAPTGWDNPGFEYGQVLYWNGAHMEVEQVPGPRFIKVSTEEEVEVPDGCQVYTQIVADGAQTGAALEALQASVKCGVVCAGEVVPDVAEVRAATRKAAMVARSSDTLEEALASYVDEMPLKDGVDRAAVLATVRGYLEA